MASNQGGASIIGTEPLLFRISAPTGSESPFPVGVWPTETFTQRMKGFYLNHEGIEVIQEPAAHTDSDSIVFFRRSDVIVAGEIFDITRFPVIDVDRGGSIQGEIDALNHLLELTIPSIPLPYLEDGGTQVIPAHGWICEEADVVEYRDMVTIVRDRIQALITSGLNLEQIKAANPTNGYRRRYGAESGPWTTDMFVEAIYKSLTRSKQ
jgi:glyoxylase-like metal-dependent hydrolase (beta-lactamase superfamily II)